jgi:predicted ATPase/DNA-binding winged helix-turn-helix (wHTH) protein
MLASPVIRFGSAELDRSAGELRLDGRRAPLGPRAFALLSTLVDRRDRAVPKNELLDTVWRGLVVEENNLQVQISSLRRLLGPQAIATIPGRGYRFVLPVEGDTARPADEPRDADEAGGVMLPPGNLPGRLPEIYGRDAECGAVRALVDAHGLVSVVGAAGIGKTRLALAVAGEWAPSLPDGAWIVELASLTDPRLVVPSLAQTLRIALAGLRDPEDELVAALRDQHALIVLDNCEPFVDTLGPLLSRLVGSSPALRILATTQEPLRLDDERVFRLGPLSVPGDASTADPTAYGAVRLFVERVRALLPRWRLGSADTAAVVEICRRLDGLPLAIELAAARVPVLGVAGVRDRLGERFRVLTGGSRVAPKRHQTLRAALDWSLALLDEAERATYRRLGVFVGSFALESAQELAAAGPIDDWTVLEHLSSLVDKSLVIAEGEPRPRYRMLESTREHALEQLAAAGETDEWLARHVRATRHALARAIRERRTELVLAETPNVRSAYDLARSVGDAESAVALATLPSMAIAVDGAVQEARQRLLDVEPLVDERLPKALVAQYWQWYGRIGLDGRLPAARCVAAFERAEALFVELGNLRHVHACRRHLAESQLDAGDLDAAAAALQRARDMEGPDWPVADRMRRLRVEGLLHAEAGRADEALQVSTTALEMAQLAGIGRYELVLLGDIARLHLEAGHAAEAVERYRALAERARQAPNGGLTLSNALAGLVAALTAQDRLDEAETVARESIPVLRRSGILLARADVLACLMARRARHESAALLLGASDRFRTGCGMARGPVEQRCRDEALQVLSRDVSPRRRAAWLAVGAGADEDALERALREVAPGTNESTNPNPEDRWAST